MRFLLLFRRHSASFLSRFFSDSCPLFSFLFCLHSVCLVRTDSRLCRRFLHLLPAFLPRALCATSTNGLTWSLRLFFFLCWMLYLWSCSKLFLTITLRTLCLFFLALRSTVLFPVFSRLDSLLLLNQC